MLMKKMLAIILVSLVLSGCEKNGSQNDLIINNTEEENVVMDENDDYELKNIEMGRKEEKDISDRLRKMVGKCKRIYSQADKGNASNIVLEEETVHTMIESIAEENVAITCGSHDYNMLNYKQVDDALSLAKTGENTETEFFVINTSGVWIYNKLQFKNKDLYVTSATAAFDDNMSPHIVQIEKIQVYDWNYIWIFFYVRSESAYCDLNLKHCIAGSHPKRIYTFFITGFIEERNHICPYPSSHPKRERTFCM